MAEAGSRLFHNLRLQLQGRTNGAETGRPGLQKWPRPFGRNGLAALPQFSVHSLSWQLARLVHHLGSCCPVIRTMCVCRVIGIVCPRNQSKAKPQHQSKNKLCDSRAGEPKLQAGVQCSAGGPPALAGSYSPETLTSRNVSTTSSAPSSDSHVRATFPGCSALRRRKAASSDMSVVDGWAQVGSIEARVLCHCPI